MHGEAFICVENVVVFSDEDFITDGLFVVFCTLYSTGRGVEPSDLRLVAAVANLVDDSFRRSYVATLGCFLAIWHCDDCFLTLLAPPPFYKRSKTSLYIELFIYFLPE